MQKPDAKDFRVPIELSRGERIFIEALVWIGDLAMAAAIISVAWKCLAALLLG